MFNFERNKQLVTIEGVSYNKDEVLNQRPPFSNHSEFATEVYNVLKEWFSAEEEMLLHTSGSTGIPKSFKASKEQMMQSARLTCSFLNLRRGDKVLLCLPVSAIAGIMILVRALVAGLDIYMVTPSGNPLKNFASEINFAAMVPLQVYNSLQNPTEKRRLEKIDNLIIGGGALDRQLESALYSFPNHIYSTYGMTETLSHIALRRISGERASLSYRTFESVNIASSEDGCLIIDAPLVSKTRLFTNDLVEIEDNGNFRIIGRKDNIINSGGVKIQLEQLESKIATVIQSRFAVSSRSDVKFGEVIVLIVESDVDIKAIKTVLFPYEIPKDIIVVSKIPLTRTGKIDRGALKRIASREKNN